MDNIRFLDDNGTFTLSNPENVSGLYFPLASETGLKSAITPGLGGDCKLDQESFLLEPVSIEDLHNRRSTRNFWCVTEDGCWSATGASAGQEAARFTPDQDESTLTAGLMWQKVSRESKRFGLRAEITSFVSPRENVEIIEVKLTNTGSVLRKLTCTAAIPIYGRSADNVRGHRNVTSMLHRTQTTQRWVSFQPFLRRLYGCSFLPHHDYGRGGRGWRDLWQDCLSLLLMDPGGVGEQIRANFGGVRVDGTNATIIGDGVGNFIADRNGIARVWMDHALWPLMTTRLYIDQTGDLDILLEAAPYFKDPQAMRGTQIDPLWNEGYGNRQQTQAGTVYTGSILEHLFIQHLAAFYEVGEHNIFRLRGGRLERRPGYGR